MLFSSRRKPRIKLLEEAPPRSGFFERQQHDAVLRHLPEELRGLVTFCYVTGWRLASEVLPLEWRQVDFAAGEVRLDPGMTKNGKERFFPTQRYWLLEGHLRLKYLRALADCGTPAMLRASS